MDSDDVDGLTYFTSSGLKVKGGDTLHKLCCGLLSCSLFLCRVICSYVIHLILRTNFHFHYGMFELIMKWEQPQITPGLCQHLSSHIQVIIKQN